jgi:thymidine phosphorylase
MNRMNPKMTKPAADGVAASAPELIRIKRDGQRLSENQISWLINGYTSGDVAEEQMAALAMAIFFRGLDDAELAAWTAAMIASGERLDFSGLSRPTTDKHSTGGVGDKITLALTPLVAACGAAVPQLSGRGLGHTGGTLDKLESIPGWQAQRSQAQMRAQLEDVGAVICAAGPGLVPADRKLYALRDVTATTDSIPLIASSIMSKKLAEGTSSLVLDVKVGSGAFTADQKSGTELARAMVGLGNRAQVATSALLTQMSAPLGRAVGNAVEVAEAVEVLAGGGPSDVLELTIALARQMLGAAGIDRVDPAGVLGSGKAMDVWRRMIQAQGGDPHAQLPQPSVTEQIVADRGGFLAELDALAVGVAAWRLGAGRARKEAPVKPAAGVVLRAKPGDSVMAGQPIITLQTDDASLIPHAIDALAGCWTITDEPPPARPVVLGQID